MLVAVAAAAPTSVFTDVVTKATTANGTAVAATVTTISSCGSCLGTSANAAAASFQCGHMTTTHGSRTQKTGNFKFVVVVQIFIPSLESGKRPRGARLLLLEQLLPLLQQ